MVVWNEEANLPIFLGNLDRLINAGVISAFVAIDQSSTDATCGLLSAYMVRRKREGTLAWYHLLKQPHAGFCEAHRQLSLDLCQTDWVLVLDADEWIEPTVPLRAMVEQAEQAGIVAISFPTYNHVIDLPGEPRMQHFGEERHWRLVKRATVAWPTTVHATPVVTGPTMEAPANAFVHHRWRLWAQPEKIARQVEWTRKTEGATAAEVIERWLLGNFEAFKKELGV